MDDAGDSGASQLLKIGSQPISIGLSGKYSAAQPAGAPDWVCA